MTRLRTFHPGGLFEISNRVTGDQLLLRPDAEVRAMILGVVGRAQKLTGLRIHAFVVLSSHYHMIATAVDIEQLSIFMRRVNGEISQRINKRYKRKGTLWESRYTAIPITQDADMQIARLRYLLAHGVKENLVDKATDWPGATSLPWLLDGTEIKGTWHWQTGFTVAERRNDFVEQPGEFDIEYGIKMSALPCWHDTPTSAWRAIVKRLVRAEERSARRARRISGKRVLGVARLFSIDPFSRVKRGEESPVPKRFARNPDVVKVMEEAKKAIIDWYREASSAFRAGDWTAPFPPGTFRPNGGFVPMRT